MDIESYTQDHYSAVLGQMLENGLEFHLAESILTKKVRRGGFKLFLALSNDECSGYLAVQTLQADDYAKTLLGETIYTHAYMSQFWSADDFYESPIFEKLLSEAKDWVKDRDKKGIWTRAKGLADYHLLDEHRFFETSSESPYGRYTEPDDIIHYMILNIAR